MNDLQDTITFYMVEIQEKYCDVDECGYSNCMKIIYGLMTMNNLEKYRLDHIAKYPQTDRFKVLRKPSYNICVRNFM